MAPEVLEANATEKENKQREADATNKSRSGVGTRVKVGSTRGKNPTVITWEAFDDSLPETLPKDLTQFMDVTGVKDEKQIVDFLIVGFNDSQYSQASDEIGEFVDPTWSKDVQSQFRLVVRNYSKGAGVSIEQAVALIKPGFAR